MNSYVRINSDHWEDAGKTWFVLEYKARENSTAVQLTLSDESGKIENRIVPVHQIEWIEE